MLALNFQEPIDSWTADEFELLFHASRKLAAILAGTPHVIRPECFGLPAPVALERFLSFPREDRAIAADWTELRLRYGDGLETVARQGPGDDGGAEEWRPLSRGPAGEEAAFGIRERSDGRAFSFPLRLGPYDIGDLRCGISGGDCRRRRDELIRTVPSLWSRLAFGMARFWEVLFRPREVRPGVTVWDESLALRRIRPDLTRPLAPGQPPLVADFDGPAGG
jgi:hypothetical protein